MFLFSFFLLIAFSGTVSAAEVWHTETVATTGDVGQYTSIALDKKNQTHISYYDATNGDLKYASKNGGKWSSETVANTGDVGKYNSLAFDNKGIPHISYYDATNGDLIYATKSSSSWIKETVASTGNVGQYTSLAFDYKGYPYISYYDATNTALMLANKSGSTWKTEVADNKADCGRYTSLVVDSSRNPHISYYDATNNDLKYAYKTNTWNLETVADGGLYTSLKLDSQGYPHISYQGYQYSRYYLFYSYYSVSNSVGSWRNVNVYTASGEYTSLVLDASDNPHISCYDSRTNVWNNMDTKNMMYETMDKNTRNGVWPNVTVDMTGDVGQYTSMALDGKGNPYISYYDATNGNLKYSYMTISTAYKVETADSLGKVGDATSIAVDQKGNPHVLYYDYYHNTWKYAYRDTAWHKKTIDTCSNSGEARQTSANSIAIDSKGYPHIIYPSVGGLKYAYKDAKGWHIEMVDANGGEHSSIAVDSDGNPHISYRSNADGFIYYNVRSDWGWCATSVLVDGHYGRYTSIAIDGQGRPCIAFIGGGDSGNGGLCYASYNGLRTGFNIEKPYLYGQVFSVQWRAVSLAVDKSGNPYIFCWPMPSDGGHLSFWYKDTTWHSELFEATVPSDRGAGWYMSVAVDKQGNPHVCYLFQNQESGNDVKEIIRYVVKTKSGWSAPVDIDYAYTKSSSYYGGYGANLSLALDSLGNPHISYYDGMKGVLKYAYLAPTVKSTDPANNAVNVSRNKTIKITFDKDIKAGGNYSKITLMSDNGKTITITKSTSGSVLTIKHSALLSANTKYKLTLYSGSITDLAGNPLAAKTITFTTGSS